MMKWLYPLVLANALLAMNTQAAEDVLLYIYADDCGACMKFNKEVAPIYPNTAEAKRLPMVKISLDEWKAGEHNYTACEVGDVFGTPTFVQLNNCQEIDRITGYSTDELFWLGLTRMQNRLPKEG